MKYEHKREIVFIYCYKRIDTLDMCRIQYLYLIRA